MTLIWVTTNIAGMFHYSRPQDQEIDFEQKKSHGVDSQVNKLFRKFDLLIRGKLR